MGLYRVTRLGNNPPGRITLKPWNWSGRSCADGSLPNNTVHGSPGNGPRMLIYNLNQVNW